jgi:putative ABC transport system permease protein
MAITVSAVGSIEMYGERMSLVMPWERLGVLLAVAVLAALVASIAPARRAIRLPIAENLATDG